MKNKEGFTLVELLAVIVVLAIIIIIALPNIVNAMNKAKEGAFKVYGKRILSTGVSIYTTEKLVELADPPLCYTLPSMNFKAGKYQGYVTTVDGVTFKLYLTDEKMYYDGVTLADIDGSTIKAGSGGITSNCP